MAMPMKSARNQMFTTERRSFGNDCQKHEDYITQHFFNQSMSLVLPGMKDIPAEILSVLSSQHFCLVKNISLSDLISQEFIEAFVKKGQVYMLSQGTHIDADDCAALLPTGDLELNLTRDTFVELGLEGRPSRYHRKRQNKYVVTIPLTASYFKPGKKYHSRVEWCINKQPNFKFTFLVAWEPNDTDLSSYSIEHYFKDILRRETQECELVASRCVHSQIKVPLLNNAHNGLGDTSEFYEWLGALTCDVDCNGEDDDYVNTYRPPEHMTNTKYCVCCTFRGFFTPDSVISVVDILRDKLRKQYSDLPWLSLTVHGYQDSIVSWQNHEHGYSVSGDNFYTFVYLPNDTYYYYRMHDENGVGS